MKFRKKPVVIEAVQLTHSKSEWPEGVVEHIEYGVPRFDEFDDSVQKWPVVRTANGNVRVFPGDWICSQVVNGKRDVWPCKPDIFEATYEPVEEER